MFEEIDPEENIAPIAQDIDYSIKVVSVAEVEGSESELESIEASENSNQLEAEPVTVKEEDRKKSYVSDSTPTKVEDSKSPLKPMEAMKCSQNSLSNFFEACGTSNKAERPLKEKKDLLVGLLNDDLSSIKITTPSEATKKVAKDENEELGNISSFIAIKNKLMGIAKKYDRKFEEVMKLFEQASCRYQVLEDCLEGKSEAKNKMWKSLEDLVLTQPHMNKEAFSILMEEKGEEEMKHRKNFLNPK